MSTGLRKSGWAKPTPLISTRRQKEIEANSAKDAEIKNLFTELDSPTMGYYLWPSRDETPMDFGIDLKALSAFMHVHIDWDPTRKYLKINPGAGTDSERRVQAAIKHLRQTIYDTKAQAIFEAPLFLLDPPTKGAMRTIVQPIFPYGTTFADRPRVVGFKLAGERLDLAASTHWADTQRPALIKSNLKRMEDHLRKNLANLQNIRGWMRMRVHFGHLNLIEYMTSFGQMESSFDSFHDMMNRTRTRGQFDKRIHDAMIASHFMDKISSYPEKFAPLDVKIGSVQNMTPKHTAIIFIATDRQEFRVEAEIDPVYFDTYVSETNTPLVEARMVTGYQFGTMKVFDTSQRKKHMEVTVVNVEDELDWTLEIATDDPISPPAALQAIVSSLSGTLATRIDLMGFSYPAMHQRDYTNITSITIKSAWQYIIPRSGYIIEVAIYRGGSETEQASQMDAGISVYHCDWDPTMESLKHTTRDRIFNVDNVFPSGLGDFLKHVQLFQSFVSTTGKGGAGSHVDGVSSG
ncbi:hypothetical protein B7494_g2207 [Chlorociboria aeruginascens]|nr:hypothetical protein B7494_g2207 [Chlorociboria aeruginascens]